jgi:uncharacterized protein involved in outer membrane biogenesis
MPSQTLLLSYLKRLIKAPRARKLALWTGGAVAVYAIAGFLVAPPIARHELQRILTERLRRQVTIERVRINPFALSASIHNFDLKERDGATSAVTFEDLKVNLTLSSIFRRGIVVESIQLAKPHVRVARYEDRKYSFQDIIDRFSKASPAPSKAPGPSPRFAVYNITVSDGRIDFDDRPEKTQHTVTDLQIGLPFVSSLPGQVDIKVLPRLSAKVNGTLFEITGETKPFKGTHEATLKIDIDNLELAKYLEYSPVPLHIRLPSGQLTTRLVLEYAAALGGEPQTLTLSGTASLRRLAVQQEDGAPLAALGRLAVDLESLDLLQRRAAVKSVRIEAPEVDIARAKDGGLNLLAVVPAAPDESPPAETPSTEPPFTFSVGEFALSNGKLQFVDATPDKPVRFGLNNISLNVNGLGNAPDAKAAVKLGCESAAKGRLTYDGSLQLAPVRTEGQLNLAGLRLDAFEPYLAQRLNAVVTSGAFATKGRLLVEVPQGQPLRIAYKADASVTNFASIDEASSQDLLSWKALVASGIDFELEPLKVSIEQVTMSDFYSRLIVNANGTMNVSTLSKKTGATAAEPAAAPQPAPAADAASGVPPNIRLGKLVLRGGRINYTDYFIKPNYNLMLSGVDGGMSEMTRDKSSDLNLSGRLNQTAPVDVAGKLNVLSKDLVLDLKASARDIELSQMSPYSGKYAGYGIEKGKLSLKLAYQIQDRKLAAQNNIYLDQLTFGEKTESTTATKLPVLFAVALLKDKNGVIDVNLPISGSLDDPQFSVGGVIVQVLVNLVEKAVTAPFALLGSLFGGGEELAFVEFPPGSAALSADDEAKLKTLAKALEERPGLKLDAGGRVEPDADRDALKRAEVDRQIKAAKLKDGGARAADAASIDEVTIEPEEYGKYLTVAYRSAKFQRPRNAIGLLKDIPVPEMEQLMLTNAQVTDGDLRSLALARAQATKDWLIETGKISPERVFIVAPKMNAEGIKDQGKPTRVDFDLK